MESEVPGLPELDVASIPEGVDRRAFLMRSAIVGAVTVITGCSGPETTQTSTPAPAATPPPLPSIPLEQSLHVVQKSTKPVMTTIDEFYKVGPGPSSSHTIGPMRITYDFYQRCTKLPADQLAKATALKVYLFGSLGATGKGHGTERAALAGIIGKEPATVDPLFLDSLRDKPDQVFKVTLGGKTFDASLKDIVYEAPKGNFPHPNTMTCKLMAGDQVLLEQEYYSVGGGFIEWKGYEPPKKGQPKYPYSRMADVQLPCIERCAYGAVKAWTGFLIASNEIPANRRVDFDTTVDAMALTAKEMNSKYKETSEGGLAVSLVLC
jgi:L-serine dehydratase